MLLLRPRAWLDRQLDRYLPAALDKRLASLGMFALGSAVLFARIADEVTDHESTQFDRTVSLTIHGFDTPTLDALMRLLTFIGSFPTVAVVTLAVLTWCWRRGDRCAFVGLLGVIVIDEALNLGLKQGYARPRPDLFQEIATLHSYSFPSGHAMAATAIYGMTAIAMARLVPRLRMWIGMAAVTLAGLIGLSRIYLGFHWVTDVLAGYAGGASILFAGMLWLEFGPKDRSVRIRSSTNSASGKALESQR